MLVHLARVVGAKHVTTTSPKVHSATSSQFSFKDRAAEALLAFKIFGESINHIYNDEGEKMSLDGLLKGDQKDI